MTRRSKWTKELIIQEIQSLSIQLRRKPAKRDSPNLYPLTRKYFGSWNNALEESGFDVVINQEAKLPAKLDENLAYFLGLLITDGHIVFDKAHKKYKVMLFNSYDDESEIIVSLIKRLFDYDAKIRSKKYGFNKRINHEIYITSKDVAGFLNGKLSIPSGAKSLRVRVPRYIFNENEEIVAGFLRGVIDGDGHVAKRHVSISSGSPGFLEDLNKIFLSMGIIPGKIRKNISGTNTCEIRLSDRNHLKKLSILLYKKSEFFYPRKKKVWEDLKNRFN